MNRITLLIGLLALGLLNSCVTPKMVYVKDMQVDSLYRTVEMPALRLQKNDRIQITVNASNTPELASPFNDGVGSYRVGDDGNVSTIVDRSSLKPGYTVDQEGNINFPVLGKIQVIGMTLEEVREAVRNMLIARKFINEPTVKVDLLNLKVTVMGAVANQSVLNVPEARITILEAITQVGGLTNVADPKAIYVIRDQNGERKKIVHDIESKSIFDSPTYYLQQNDIVYVEPKMGVSTPREERARQFWSMTIGLAGLVMSTLIWLK